MFTPCLDWRGSFEKGCVQFQQIPHLVYTNVKELGVSDLLMPRYAMTVKSMFEASLDCCWDGG